MTADRDQGQPAPSARSAGTADRKVVLFSGGSACRTINIALCKQPAKLTRIVPAWDSGGSSKALRETFDMLPVGDIRQALMTMAHGEGRAGEVVKICNARLSDELDAGSLRAEFDYFAGGAHPLLQSMPIEVRDAMLGYLGLFRSSLPADFDFRNGSIGNFVLTGAYLAHGRAINRAIAVFRNLCGIEGDVWPASVQEDVQLSATLRNGKRLSRQHLVTRLDGEDAKAGIAQIELTAGAGHARVTANSIISNAVAQAQIIVLGPGSFYTSILPHLLVEGVGWAIGANSEAPKVFIGNILECAETRGATVASLAETLIREMKARSGGKAKLTHILANRELFPFEKTVGKFAYLKHGALGQLCRAEGIQLVEGDFEDAWTRGQHDGEAVALALLDIVG